MIWLRISCHIKRMRWAMGEPSRSEKLTAICVLNGSFSRTSYPAERIVVMILSAMRSRPIFLNAPASRPAKEAKSRLFFQQ
jgi:hypothetical protein